MLKITRISGGSDLEKLVMARIFIQASELLEATSISKEDQERIKSLCVHDIAPILIHFGQMAEAFIEDANEQIGKFSIDENGNAQNFPHIIRLEQKTSDYLYTARNFLRELGAIFEPFFGVRFRESKLFYDPSGQGDGIVAKWAQGKFGKDDALSLMLSDHQRWIAEVCMKRNAFEHPGGSSGTLVIENFHIGSDKLLIPPMWRREPEGEDSNLIQDMDSIFYAALEFAEDTIARMIEKFIIAPLDISVIPTEKQDPKCPVRLHFTISK